MSELGPQLGLVLLILAASFGAPGLAIGLLWARKRKARIARRSPIGIDLLRGPGHSLRGEIEELRFDVMGNLLGLAIFPSVMLATHLAQSYWLKHPESPFRWIFMSVIVVSITCWLLRDLYSKSTRLDTLRLGLDAEIAVGQELDQLMRQGAIVFHDMPAEGFNIDHVVIAPQGVYAVETKGYSKRNDLEGKARARVAFDGQTLRFPGWTSSDPIEQAQRQAHWLAKWLSSATGGPIAVTPVLALPGWFVERSGEGDVRVYSGRELCALLQTRAVQSLRDEEVQRVAHQVEQRCRNVTPSYRIDAPPTTRAAS